MYANNTTSTTIVPSGISILFQHLNLTAAIDTTSKPTCQPHKDASKYRLMQAAMGYHAPKSNPWAAGGDPAISSEFLDIFHRRLKTFFHTIAISLFQVAASFSMTALVVTITLSSNYSINYYCKFTALFGVVFIIVFFICRAYPDTNCQASLSTSSSSSYKSHISERQKDMSFSVGTSFSASGTIKGITLAAELSASYSRTTSESSIYKTFVEQKGEVYTARATCFKMDVAVQAHVRPLFTSGFYSSLVKLDEAAVGPEWKRKEAYVAFARSYGTHYMTETDFGASIYIHQTYTSRSHSSSQENARSSCFNLATSAGFSVSAQVAEVSTKVTTELNKCDKSKTTDTWGGSTASTNLLIFTRGTTAMSFAQWSAGDYEPVPIKLKVMPLQELMKQEWLNENANYGFAKTLNAGNMRFI